MKKEKATRVKTLKFIPTDTPHNCKIYPSKMDVTRYINPTNSEEFELCSTQLEEHIFLVFNKRAVLDGQPPNRIVGGDVIAGTMFIMATDDDGNVRSLEMDEILNYSYKFYKMIRLSDEEIEYAKQRALNSSVQYKSVEFLK
jgi:hypothetical protein